MSNSTYPSSSPYFQTDVVTNEFLDVWTNRSFPALETDVSWVITTVYDQRPDLLAHDLYGNSRLWWVFASRNPNTLKDPLFDFRTGVRIYLPNANTLVQSLGI